jgi:hypothetical protein
LQWLRGTWKAYEAENPTARPKDVRLAMLEKVARRIKEYGDDPSCFEMKTGLSAEENVHS